MRAIGTNRAGMSLWRGHDRGRKHTLADNDTLSWEFDASSVDSAIKVAESAGVKVPGAVKDGSNVAKTVTGGGSAAPTASGGGAVTPKSETKPAAKAKPATTENLAMRGGICIGGGGVVGGATYAITHSLKAAIIAGVAGFVVTAVGAQMIDPIDFDKKEEPKKEEAKKEEPKK